LKWRILLQAAFVTALTIVVGYIILVVFLEDSSTELVRFLTSFHVPEELARAWYWRWVGNNKTVVIAIGYLILFSVFFYIALAKLEDYLRQVENGINNITSDSKESIEMIEELKPIEKRLTEIKDTLKMREQEAAEAEQKKNDLVVYLAHDLKTPLTSVVAYLTMLDNYKDMPEKEREKYTHIALEKASRLGELVDEFFELIQFNLQDIELERQELNLSMMMEQMAEEFYGVFRGKGVKYELQAEEGLFVNGDPDKLARVFGNILRNAIAYCYPNSVIRIEAERIEEHIRIMITNRGDTIPEDKLQTIFEKFYRLDEARHSQTGGAGLGLAIAKTIVELHGGTIEAKSMDEETKFIVTLPHM
jgi:two-component system sensor histidine kinase VanS